MQVVVVTACSCEVSGALVGERKAYGAVSVQRERPCNVCVSK